MGTVILVVIVLALVLGGLGLLIEGLLWLLGIGAILLVAAAVAGYVLYRRVGSFFRQGTDSRPQHTRQA